MPVICIGPVCIPWTAVVPLMVWLLRPIFVRLPTPWQEFITSTAKSTRVWMQANVWDPIGWKSKKKAPPSSTVEMTPVPAAGKPAALSHRRLAHAEPGQPDRCNQSLRLRCSLDARD